MLCAALRPGGGFVSQWAVGCCAHTQAHTTQCSAWGTSTWRGLSGRVVFFYCCKDAALGDGGQWVVGMGRWVGSILEVSPNPNDSVSQRCLNSSHPAAQWYPREHKEHRSRGLCLMPALCAGLTLAIPWHTVTLCVLQGLTASRAYGSSLTAVPLLWSTTAPSVSSHP